MCRQVGEDVSSLACVLAHLCFVFSHSFWNFSAFLLMEVFWDVLACWPLSATVHYDTKCSVRKIKKKCCTLFFWLSELLRSKINNSDWNVSCKYKCEIYKDCFHKNIPKKNAGNIIYLCFLYKYSKTGHDGNTFSASKTRQAIRRRQKSKRIKNIYIVYIPVLQCAVHWSSDQGGETRRRCVCKAVVSLGKTLHLNVLLWVLSTVHDHYIWYVCVSVKRFGSWKKRYDKYKELLCPAFTKSAAWTKQCRKLNGNCDTKKWCTQLGLERLLTFGDYKVVQLRNRQLKTSALSVYLKWLG